jgi:endonuclease/exonuclease/phosphatase family metal-dependent hydrolase
MCLRFNIEKSRKIELALAELQQLEKTSKVDIYLFQEVDETAVQSIATALGLNYLFFPIVYNKMIKKDIGNAILARGTIEHPQKLILPHSKWVNGRRRHVTIGEVHTGSKKILVYSVHTETVMMGRKKRMDQVDSIIEHAVAQFPQYSYFLLGGDFNTLCSKDSRLLTEKMTGKGFNWSTAAVGSTARAFFGLAKPRHDYIFSRGFKLINAFKIVSSKSSDHYPVFATFGF